MQISAERAPEPAPESICVNCGCTRVAEFCAGCGQRTPTDGDYSLRSFLRAALGHVTNYDGRLLSTLRKLFFRPGQLARDHFEGRRAQHLDPFRIFVLANLAAWLITPHTGLHGFSVAYGQRYAALARLWMRLVDVRAYLTGVPSATLLERIDAIGSTENSVAVLCLVPMLALGLWAALAGRGYRYVQHLVFGAHFYCIQICCALLYIGVLFRPIVLFCKAHAPSLVPVVVNIWSQHMAMAPALMLYLYFGLRRAYLLSPRESAWRAVVLGLWACTVSRLFFDVAFVLCLIWA
ncbi:MAG TPA: DUF3667 domain-containing protein [Polyangia bacterium]|jgi:hypothetical protein